MVECKSAGNVCHGAYDLLTGSCVTSKRDEARFGVWAWESQRHACCRRDLNINHQLTTQRQLRKSLLAAFVEILILLGALSTLILNHLA